MAELAKEEMEKARRVAENEMRPIDMQVDTVNVDMNEQIIK